MSLTEIQLFKQFIQSIKYSHHLETDFKPSHDNL